MFFGKYLVENGVVTQEQLVEAIIMQMEDIPSIVRIIQKKRLLDSDEIIDLVDQSVCERKNIVELITEKSIFSKDEMNGLLMERNRTAKGLGEILIKKGYASSIMVVEHINKYWNYQNNTKSRRDEIDDVDGVLKFNTGGEFIKIFDRGIYNFINEEVEKIKDRDREQHIFNIRKELSLLATLASMGNFEHITDLFQIWLSVLDKSKTSVEKCHWNEVSSGLKYMMELSWRLREQIVEKGNEKSLLKERDWKKKYYDGIRRAEYLLQENHNIKAA